MRAFRTQSVTLLLALLAPVQVLAQEETPETAQDSPAPGSSEVRLGYVDIQYALTQVEDGRRAMEQLESERESRQTQLDQRETDIGEREQELRQLSEQLDQELVMMDAETRRQRLTDYQRQVEEYQQQLGEYQQFFMTNQQELVDMEAAATRDIVARMVEIVQQIAQERNLTMVFEKTRSALVWAQSDLDLTDELIRRYEATE